MRKKPVFGPTKCNRCGKIYIPNGPTSMFCDECRMLVNKERKQKWYANNVPNAYSSPPPKKITDFCVVCGLPFYSTYNGINCCQKHYNIAYRTGSPFTPEGRKNTNSFREYNGHIIGTTNSGVDYFFDKDDLKTVCKYSWCVSKTGYLVANINHKVTKLHRYILNVQKDQIIDHANGNPLDNRKSNLRITSQKNNSRNNKVSKSNELQQLGISTTASGKFRARIMVDGKEIRIGLYSCIDDAIKARKDAELKYFGDYAPSLRTQDSICNSTLGQSE